MDGAKEQQFAIAKEMKDVRVAFDIMADDAVIPPAYQQMKCHIIFDVKMENFRRKARLVAGGHMTETPASLTYSSVVSRYTVRIALTIAALNGLNVQSSDIQNAYLTAPCKEKIWTILGTEWGVDVGRRAYIRRALYSLKASGASFCNHLANCMMNLGYKSCLADRDLWYKSQQHPGDGEPYYLYVLLYVDDCLCIHHDAKKEIHHLDKYFMMKKGSIGGPDIYLGARIRPQWLENGVYAWGMSSSKYFQEAI